MSGSLGETTFFKNIASMFSQALNIMLITIRDQLTATFLNQLPVVKNVLSLITHLIKIHFVFLMKHSLSCMSSNLSSLHLLHYNYYLILNFTKYIFIIYLYVMPTLIIGKM